MPKPAVYIIEQGGLGEPEPNANLGEGAYSVGTTVGLITYETGGTKRLMLVDSGLAASFEKIKTGFLNHGNLEDVTHILMTHFDQDHPQNNSKFPGAMIVSAVGTARSGTFTFGNTESLYPDNYIEDENIRFVNVSKTHSRDEMYYLVHSQNQGLCLFAGDLMFASVEELPAEFSIEFDKRVTLDIVKKYKVLKGIYTDYPQLDAIFLSHSPNTMTRAGLKEYLQMLEQEPYVSFMEEFIEDLKQKASDYEGILGIIRNKGFKNGKGHGAGH